MAAEQKEEKMAMSLDDTPVEEAMLELVSNGKDKFKVSRKAAMISGLVKTTCMDMDSSATEVPIPGVDSKTLAFIVEYMKQHNGTEPPCVEKPLKSKLMKDIVKHPWDAPFIDRVFEAGKTQLKKLVLAANYMDIKALLFLACARTAAIVKGQPVEKIKALLADETKGEESKKDEKKEEKPKVTSSEGKEEKKE